MKIVTEDCQDFIEMAELYEIVENSVYELQIATKYKYLDTSNCDTPEVNGVWISLISLDPKTPTGIIGIDEKDYFVQSINVSKYSILVIYYHEDYQPEKLIDRYYGRNHMRAKTH